MQLILINSLRYLPTLLFLVTLYVGNTLLNTYNTTNKGYYISTPLTKDDLLWDKDFVSLKEKQEWCKQRLQCRTLAEVGFFEAGIQTDSGVISVMSVVMNRVESEHPIFANQNTIVDVVHKPMQFSYRNGKQGELHIPSKRQRERMWVLAYDKMNGLVEDNTDGSLYYYADYVSPPKFALAYEYTITYSPHNFYKH